MYALPPLTHQHPRILTPTPPTLPGNCGIEVDLPPAARASDRELGPLAPLFAEELGLVLEVNEDWAADVVAEYAAAGIPAAVIGKVC